MPRTLWGIFYDSPISLLLLLQLVKNEDDMLRYELAFYFAAPEKQTVIARR